MASNWEFVRRALYAKIENRYVFIVTNYFSFHDYGGQKGNTQIV